MILAHDLGTTGNKASIHDDSGRLLSATTVEYGTDFRPGGVAEQSPDDWWDAVREATSELLRTSGRSPDDVSGIVISGQMMGAVLLDGDYRPVRPAIIWADDRSTAQTAQLLERIPGAEAYRELGHQLNPTYSIAKVMWVRDNEPDVWRRVRHICLAKDYVNYLLTGELVTDPSDASSTNAYNQRSGQWSTRVLEAAGIDPALMPRIVASTDIVGHVTDRVADQIGLRAGTPVIVGGGDGPMAAVGAGVISHDDGVYVSLGSSSWVSCASDVPLHDPQMRSMTFNHVVPGKFVPTATMQAGAASVSWAIEVLGLSGMSTAEAVEGAAEGRGAATGLYFLPHLMGERSPYWNAEAAGAFVGLERFHTTKDMMRAVLEGVGFNLATCLGALRDAGRDIDGVDAIAGGALSDTWLQVLADIWGFPVRRRTVVREANSMGAAVTGLVGLGRADFGAARGLSHISAEFAPDPAEHERYRSHHEMFLDAYSRLEGWFTKRAALL